MGLRFSSNFESFQIPEFVIHSPGLLSFTFAAISSMIPADRSGFRKVRLKNLHAVTGGVGVAVNNPWNYRAAVQINHLCLGALELEHVLIISDRQNFSVADGDGFKNVILRINGDDLARIAG